MFDLLSYEDVLKVVVFNIEESFLGLWFKEKFELCVIKVCIEGMCKLESKN